MAESAAATSLAPPHRPPRRRWLRWLLAALALLVLLPAAGLAVLLAGFDADSLKPRIAAAVEGATGRRLTLAGPIGLKPALVPTITLDEVALSNLPGGSRPEMLRVRRVEVQLALLPLLSRRLELRRVALREPDLLLETTPEGQPNWRFAPSGEAPANTAPATPTPPAPTPVTPAAEPDQRSLGITLGRLAISGGLLTWRDGQTGRSRQLALPQFEAEATGDDAALRLNAAMVVEGLEFALHGRLGPLAGLTDPAPATPWPFSLVLEGEGARGTVEGGVARPRQFAGWTLAAAAEVADLARFSRLLPDAPLPPLHGLTLAARLAEAAPGGGPEVSELHLTMGESDLNALLPGLRLLHLEASLPQGDGPLALEAEARSGEVPLRLAGSVGSPLRLLPPQPGAPAGRPWPLELALQAASAAASAKGSIADPRGLTGVDLAVSARVPDLAALAPLAGRSLPPLRDLTLETRLAERGPGFEAGAFLRGLRFSSSAGDLEGDLTYVVGQRQGVMGQLASHRLDLDALLARPPAATAAPPAASPAAADRRVIPDLPLPLEALRVTDSALRWSIGELRAGGVPMREAQLALAIQDGKARLDPLAVTLPGGRITLRGAADVTTEPPTVQIAGLGAGLDLPALLGAFGVAQRPSSGRMDFSADLRGQGRGLRAVAATAHGNVAVGLANLRLPAGMLPAQLGPGLALPAEGLGISGARAQFAVEAGIAQLRELIANTDFGRITGEGTINLRDETLAMRLNTDLRLPLPGLPQGLRIRAPVPLTGSLGAPRLDWGGVEGEVAGAAAGQVLERGIPRELQAPAQELLRGLFGRGR